MESKIVQIKADLSFNLLSLIHFKKKNALQGSRLYKRGDLKFKEV